MVTHLSGVIIWRSLPLRKRSRDLSTKIDFSDDKYVVYFMQALAHAYQLQQKCKTGANEVPIPKWPKTRFHFPMRHFPVIRTRMLTYLDISCEFYVSR